jgi:hypothetical protein
VDGNHHQRTALRDIGQVFGGDLIDDVEGAQNPGPDLIVVFRLADAGIEVIQFLPTQDVLNLNPA